MERVFASAPSLIGKRIKYVNIDPDARSRKLKTAIDCSPPRGWSGLALSAWSCPPPANSSFDVGATSSIRYGTKLIERLRELLWVGVLDAEDRRDRAAIHRESSV